MLFPKKSTHWIHMMRHRIRTCIMHSKRKRRRRKNTELNFFFFKKGIQNKNNAVVYVSIQGLPWNSLKKPNKRLRTKRKKKSPIITRKIASQCVYPKKYRIGEHLLDVLFGWYSWRSGRRMNWRGKERRAQYKKKQFMASALASTSAASSHNTKHIRE